MDEAERRSKMTQEEREREDRNAEQTWELQHPERDAHGRVIAPADVVRCPCDCKSLPEFHLADAAKALNYIGLPAWDIGQKMVHSVDENEAEYKRTVQNLLLGGMQEEREHCDVTHGDAILTAKIALAHLKEDPYYYEKLKKAGL